MAHKTFISYKFDEAQGVRDRIIETLGADAIYYQGEDGYSQDMSSHKAESIKEYLKGMLFDTSVTIVVISPRMKQSNWIDWEIEYSLREYERNGIKSHTNGVVGVIMKYAGGYDWIRSISSNPDGCKPSSYSDYYLYDIILKNRFNQVPIEYSCDRCKTVNSLTGSYISFVEEEVFLSSHSKYIENAFDKSQKLWNYDICKTR